MFKLADFEIFLLIKNKQHIAFWALIFACADQFRLLVICIPRSFSEQVFSSIWSPRYMFRSS